MNTSVNSEIIRKIIYRAEINTMDKHEKKLSLIEVPVFWKWEWSWKYSKSEIWK